MIGTISQIDRQQLTALLGCPRARRIDSIHVHHTWRPARADWRGEPTLAAMRRYHVGVLRWVEVAQHLTIGPDGSLWTGRSVDLPPASAAGCNGTVQQGPLMVARGCRGIRVEESGGRVRDDQHVAFLNFLKTADR